MHTPRHSDEIASVYGPLRPIFVPVGIGFLDPLELLRISATSHFNLSSLEIALLRCLTEGLVNKQMAARLDITESKVKNALKGVYRKLGVTGRNQAGAFAAHCGFGKPIASLSQFFGESRSKGRG